MLSIGNTPNVRNLQDNVNPSFPVGRQKGPISNILTIDVTLIERRDWFMNSKLIYWIPVVGVFVTLMKYDKDNGMGAGWCYYQAFILVIAIWIAAFFSYAGH